MGFFSKLFGKKDKPAEEAGAPEQAAPPTPPAPPTPSQPEQPQQGGGMGEGSGQQG